MIYKVSVRFTLALLGLFLAGSAIQAAKPLTTIAQLTTEW